MLQSITLSRYELNLTTLRNEVNAYKNEENLWKVEGEINNSAGNLVVHVLGSLRGFLGAVMGGTGYVRNRDAEFTVKGVSRDELLKEIDITWEEIKSTINQVSDEDLAKIYHIPGTEYKYPGAALLVGFLEHLVYHIGQINYHRRLLDQ